VVRCLNCGIQDQDGRPDICNLIRMSDEKFRKRVYMAEG